LAYESIVGTVLNDKSVLFFFDTPMGTGNTFLINVLLAYIRSQDGIALALASSGMCTILLDGGRMAHSALKLLLDIHFAELPTCNNSKGSGMGKVV